MSRATDHEIWQWKQRLNVIKSGGKLSLDPGLVGDWQYICQWHERFEGLIVLGAGCGTGRIEAELAKRGASVICLDIITEAVQIAKIHSELNGTTQSEGLLCGDLRRSPFRDKTFDLTYSGGVVEHLEDPETALAEYFRTSIWA